MKSQIIDEEEIKKIMTKHNDRVRKYKTLKAVIMLEYTIFFVWSFALILTLIVSYITSNLTFTTWGLLIVIILMLTSNNIIRVQKELNDG